MGRRTRIHLASNLSFDASSLATEVIDILAKRGSGKTYLATKLAEEMLSVGVQVVVIDPVGNWYGLRLGADGKPDGGKDIKVLGGRHGDIPIEPTAGRVVAKTLVETGMSAVVDVSYLKTPQQRQFMTDFAETLLDQRKRHPAPMHIFWEEAYRFMPQRQRSGSKSAMLEATEELVTMGRNFGIGSTVIAQRSAQVTKNVLTQAGVLIAMRTNAKIDRKVIEEWIDFHGVEKQTLELSALEQGEAYVWWPGEFGLKRIHVATKTTFDASSSPKLHGDTRRRKLRPVDMDALRHAMAETIERIESEDPRRLKREIGELRRKLQTAERKPPQKEIVEKVVEVQVPNLEIARKAFMILIDASKEIRKMIDTAPKPKVPERRATILPPPPDKSSNGVPKVRRKKKRNPVSVPAPPPIPIVPGVKITGGAIRMLQALLMVSPNGLPRNALGVNAGLKTKGGTFGTYLSRLKSAGYIEELDRSIYITDAGIAFLGDDVPDMPTTPEDKVRFWCQGKHIRGQAKEMLRFLFEHSDRDFDREELAEAVGLEVKGGTFGTYLSHLYSCHLVEKDGGRIRISSEVMGDA